MCIRDRPGNCKQCRTGSSDKRPRPAAGGKRAAARQPQPMSHQGGRGSNQPRTAIWCPARPGAA
eukprot:11282708-Alexandrium_andersonii.AAC.1